MNIADSLRDSLVAAHKHHVQWMNLGLPRCSGAVSEITPGSSITRGSSHCHAGILSFPSTSKHGGMPVSPHTTTEPVLPLVCEAMENPSSPLSNAAWFPELLQCWYYHETAAPNMCWEHPSVHAICARTYRHACDTTHLD